MKTGVCFTACAILIGQFIVISSPEASSASATPACADDTRLAIARARAALEADKPADDRAALACLVDAVAAMDERLQGLSDGSTPFEGQIYAPKGVAFTKPSVQERR